MITRLFFLNAFYTFVFKLVDLVLSQMKKKAWILLSLRLFVARF
ncbi:hypothetical protein HMPREF9554_01727 [Treponema phagedenis F0421]|nr:hypothetical protein HMPREF9554_01727 [Treponema phagedenis F0421]